MISRAIIWVSICTLVFPRGLRADGPEIGKPAPPLNLQKIVGATNAAIPNWQNLHGKVVVLDFWATWCGPCVESIPHWNELVESFSGQPVQFLAITDENEDVVTTFLKKRSIKSWVGLEGLSATKQAYDIHGIPTTVLVNQTGTVVAVTHPALLRPEHIREVVETGHSTLPKRQKAADENDRRVEREPASRPVFELVVRPSPPIPEGHGFDCWETGATKYKGEYASVKSAVISLFKVRECLLEIAAALPEQRYDFSVILPDSSPQDRDALLAGMFRSAFSLDVQRTKTQREAIVLRKTSRTAPGLNPARKGSRGGGGQNLGGLTLDNGTISWPIHSLEKWLHAPVIDETGDTNRYDIRLRWKLSAAEQLLASMDRRVIGFAMEPNAEREKKLTEAQRSELTAIRSGERLEAFPEEQRENIRRLRVELAKPDEDRFMPDAAAVQKAVEEQWGLSLHREPRLLEGLAVKPVKSGN